jgi:hypothetical protein
VWSCNPIPWRHEMWVSPRREGLGLHTNLSTTHRESSRRLMVTLPRSGRQGMIAEDRARANRTTRRVMTQSNRVPRTCAQTPWVIDVAKTPLPSRQHAHRLHTHHHVRPSCMTVPGDRDALPWVYQWLPSPAFSPWGSLNINVSRPPSVVGCTTHFRFDMRSAANITTPS